MTFYAGRGALALLRTTAVLVATGVVGAGRVIMGPSGWYCLPIGGVAFLCGWYLPRLIQSLNGELSDTHLYVCYGVWWRRETTVSLSVIRTYEMWRPPLHAVFGCRTVILRFAGGCVWLPLLDARTACRLAERLEEL